MKCLACGTDLAADAVFCQKCGVRVEVDAPKSPTGGSDPHGGNFPVSSAQNRTDLANEPEHELWKGGFSAQGMYGSWILATIVSIGIVVGSFSTKTYLLLVAIPIIWLGLLAYLVYRKLNVHYTLTNQRFIHQSGILVRSTDRIEVIQIDDVTFIQGLFERLIGVGTIKISSADKTHPVILLEGIADVQRISGLIDDTRRKDRRRRGVYMEQI